MCTLPVGVFWVATMPVYAASSNEADRQISFAEHYLKEFEKEVARQKGGQKNVIAIRRLRWKECSHWCGLIRTAPR